MKKHEDFDTQTKDIISLFATARAKAKELLQSQHPKSDEIQEQKATMDKYSRNFAFRMERRQFLLLSSVNFHHSAQLVCIFKPLNIFPDSLVSQLASSSQEYDKKSNAYF